MAFNFEKLEVYQEAVALADEVYELTKNFPKDEMFGLTSQLRRSATSVSLNVAEGSGRSTREFCFYVKRARASSYECVPLLEISRRQNYISAAEQEYFYSKLNGLARMLSGLINSLKDESP